MRRAVPLVLGAAILAAAWGGGAAPVGGPFVAHMTMHVLVVAVAAPLLALALAGSRSDPVRRWPALFPPVPISLIELVAVWAWHAPALHHAARHGALGLALEQASFLIAGALLWLAAFGGAAGDRAERAGAGCAAMLLTSMHMTLLGALLALAPRPLYPHGGAAGPAALDDQHLGGVIMLLGGGTAYLAGGLVLLLELLRGRAPKERVVA